MVRLDLLLPPVPTQILALALAHVYLELDPHHGRSQVTDPHHQDFPRAFKGQEGRKDHRDKDHAMLEHLHFGHDLQFHHIGGLKRVERTL